jgi:hypothetical protein
MTHWRRVAQHCSHRGRDPNAPPPWLRHCSRRRDRSVRTILQPRLSQHALRHLGLDCRTHRTRRPARSPGDNPNPQTTAPSLQSTCPLLRERDDGLPTSLLSREQRAFIPICGSPEANHGLPCQPRRIANRAQAAGGDRFETPTVRCASTDRVAAPRLGLNCSRVPTACAVG